MAGSKTTYFVASREVIIVVVAQATINQPHIPSPPQQNIVNP